MKSHLIKLTALLFVVVLVGCGEEQPIEGKYGCYGLAEDVAECEKRAEASKKAKELPKNTPSQGF